MAKRGAGSRAKGCAAEREALKLLRQYFGGVPWERRGCGNPGPDIITPDGFPWCVEVKHQAGVKVKHFYRPTARLESFVAQALQQARELGKAPMLLVKAEGLWFVHVEGIPGNGWLLLDDWAPDAAYRLHTSDAMPPSDSEA